ncbi:MAG: hypothetical protein Q9M91_09005 [Candidatus Dojkabacteria bacterium]|nr:hypothetical protein [Candidatus Dojkabacteria bacterium]MDQ7021911.1 hypothetical protein [Candidatus Dojkabacteria bacterium]
MSNNIKEINKFMRDKNSVTIAATLSLAALSVHFLFVGFFQFNLIGEVLAFSSYTLYRMLSVLLAIFLGVIAYSLYSQNQRLVNEALKKMKEKVVEEARDIADKVEDALDGDDETEVKNDSENTKTTSTAVEGEVVDKPVKESSDASKEKSKASDKKSAK